MKKIKFYFTVVNLLFFWVLIFSCKKEKDKVKSSFIIDSIFDIDSNKYHTININGKWWTMENLKTKRFNNGTQIKNGQNESAWLEKKSMYCVYNNFTTTPGLLYNYNAVSDTNGLAPKGWHVATEADWAQLELFLGMTNEQINNIGWRGTNEGEKLKVEGEKAWKRFATVWANNESGFSAEAGSCRLPNGKWGNPGLFFTGFWWCLNLNNSKSFYRYLDYKNKNIFRDETNSQYGMSVRCVKDM
jgi:uncharacterized protein (TIGR02145 family)